MLDICQTAALESATKVMDCSLLPSSSHPTAACVNLGAGPGFMGVSEFEKASFEREPGCREVVLVAASHPSWAARSRAGVTSARDAADPHISSAHAWSCQDAAADAQRPRCRAVPTCEALGSFAWSSRCLKAQAEGLPCSVRLTPCSQERGHTQPDLMGPQQMHGQPSRRPAVPGKVPWESSWVKAPARTYGVAPAGEGASRVGELQGCGDQSWNWHLEKGAGTQREAKGRA